MRVILKEFKQGDSKESIKMGDLKKIQKKRFKIALLFREISR